ncbi:MAG: alpha/beta fold hydrolase [Pyrinomonadaceae bacterium]|nr:alpha/beta fold hydrolase [Pyrinomonadaceae bacterium]
MSTVLAVLILVTALYSSEIVNVQLSDGEILKGKLRLPENQKHPSRLVIFIHGTGPSTYLDRRKIGGVDFNYYDLFGEEFNRRGIGFFSYNKRGVAISDKPPLYYEIDREKFKKAVPSIETEDLSMAIEFLRKDPRLKKAKIILLGWSEGTIIASMLAGIKENRITALLLAGYAHENMADIIKWQFSGESSMVNLNKAFDKDGDRKISSAEYIGKDRAAAAMRTRGLKNAKFEQLDIDKDSFISAKDFGKILEPRYKLLSEKIEQNDGEWIWKNYFRVSTNWLGEHFQLEANKTRLLREKKPIFVFHGTDDASTDIYGVYRLSKSFAERGKTNLRTYVFKGHNHDLNFLSWAVRKKMPEGIRMIFDVSERMIN